MCSGRGRVVARAQSQLRISAFCSSHIQTPPTRVRMVYSHECSGLMHSSTPPSRAHQHPPASLRPHLRGRGAADTASFSITSTRNLSEAARGEQLPLDV